MAQCARESNRGNIAPAVGRFCSRSTDLNLLNKQKISILKKEKKKIVITLFSPGSGGITCVWGCQMEENMGEMTKGEKYPKS